MEIYITKWLSGFKKQKEISKGILECIYATSPNAASRTEATRTDAVGKSKLILQPLFVLSGCERGPSAGK